MSSESINILLFSAPMCSACQNVYQTIENTLGLAPYRGQIGFKSLNGLENLDMLARYGLATGGQLLPDTTFPVTLFFKGAKEVERRTDDFDSQSLITTLDTLLGKNTAPASTLATLQPKGAIIVRCFYEDSDQDADFTNAKELIINIQKHQKLFQRLHFEWQSRKALFARRYQLESHPKGLVTIFFDSTGQEAARVEGLFDAAFLETTIVQVFQGQKLGILRQGQAPKPKEMPTANRIENTSTYASNPQRKLKLVEFIKNNCASCQSLSPTIEALTQKYGAWLQWQKINGEEQPQLLQEWRRKALQALMFYPIVFLLDEEGKVLYSSDDYRKMMSELDEKVRHFMFRHLA